MGEWITIGALFLSNVAFFCRMRWLESRLFRTTHLALGAIKAFRRHLPFVSPPAQWSMANFDLRDIERDARSLGIQLPLVGPFVTVEEMELKKLKEEVLDAKVGEEQG